MVGLRSGTRGDACGFLEVAQPRGARKRERRTVVWIERRIRERGRKADFFSDDNLSLARDSIRRL